MQCDVFLKVKNEREQQYCTDFYNTEWNLIMHHAACCRVDFFGCVTVVGDEFNEKLFYLFNANFI